VCAKKHNQPPHSDPLTSTCTPVCFILIFRCENLPEISIRFAKEDLEMQGFCFRIYILLVQIVPLRYFPKVWWYKFIVRLIPSYQVLNRLRIHSGYVHVNVQRCAFKIQHQRMCMSYSTSKDVDVIFIVKRCGCG